MASDRSSYSAAEQGLGYIYQPRFALLKMLSLPEATSMLIEKEDDLEFADVAGKKVLGSLKHKAAGDTVTDLSIDFWKSVRVWLAHYKKNGRLSCDSTFFLFTTASVVDTPMLTLFREGAGDGEARAAAAAAVLSQTESKLILTIVGELDELTPAEKADFYSRILIIDSSVRIDEIPERILDQHLRTVRRDIRRALFERLEGWWHDLIIRMLTGERTEPVVGYEISDKLSTLAEEYRSDNLPITFRNQTPDAVDVERDPRLFVEQLRALSLSGARIRSAIIDYYRAFEQRSSWARENLLISGEIEEYEDRLVEEWTRYREVVFEDLNDASDDQACLTAGRELYRWAEMETSALRIRERVTEPYVVRGAYQMLANTHPLPRVYWHPRFLARLKELLGVAA